MSTQTGPAAADGETQKQTIHIGTRQSMLARVQADEIAHALRKVCPEYHYETHAMKTAGDNDQGTALHKFNEKALWTQDLEVRLQSGELDLIVHCLKDMPTQIPHDLEIGCIPARKDPRDALVIKESLADKYHSLSDFPEGSVIGTSSLRRIAQLKRHYPHLHFADVRGNLGTRLRKLDDPESSYSAIILAVAGLLRLGMSKRISTYLSKSNGGMLYAVGQGALALEIRKNDTRTLELVSRIACDRSTRRGLAERSLMRTLEGGCSVPIGIETEWIPKRNVVVEGSGIGIKPAEEYHQLTGVATSTPENQNHETETSGTDVDDDGDTDEMVMRAIVVSLDGTEAAEIETRRIVSTREDAEMFGWEAARMLVEKGADKILEKIQLNRQIIGEQGEA